MTYFFGCFTQPTVSKQPTNPNNTNIIKWNSLELKHFINFENLNNHIAVYLQKAFLLKLKIVTNIRLFFEISNKNAFF
jgi:hypothetical protein